MGRILLAVTILVGLVGCSDPRDDILPVGSQAVVVGQYPALLELTEPEEHRKAVFLAPGTRVTIGADPSPRKSKMASRFVKVVVETGKDRDAAGDMFRLDLRPIP